MVTGAPEREKGGDVGGQSLADVGAIGASQIRDVAYTGLARDDSVLPRDPLIGDRCRFLADGRRWKTGPERRRSACCLVR